MCFTPMLHSRRFVEERLRLELMEKIENEKDQAEQHIQPYDAQEARRRQYCLSEERRKDHEDLEAARWAQWCRDHPQDPPPRYVSAMQNEVRRQERRLQRLERAITRPYAELAAEEAALRAAHQQEPASAVRRIEVPWKQGRTTGVAQREQRRPIRARAVRFRES